MTRCPTCGRSIVMPRAGQALSAVFDAIRTHGKRAFEVSDITGRLKTLDRKQVYNAIGYLNRRGDIEMIARGRYRATTTRGR